MKTSQTIAFLGGQWGDEGKGKIVDWAAQNSDICARATGGNNAGHTVIVKDKKYVFHLLPSAITHSHVECLLGNGMVMDLFVLLKEIKVLQAQGFTLDNLKISSQIHVIFPFHKLIEHYKESNASKKIGTTKRGIGPTYADKINRTGLTIADLYDFKELKEHIQSSYLELKQSLSHKYNLLPDEFDNDLATMLPAQYRPKENQDVIEHLTNLYIQISIYLNKFIVCGISKLSKARESNKQIVLEGAQGLFLDIDHGTYPFVTSSNPSIGGMLTGLGIPTVDHTYSIIKAYTTRVGEGSFVCELGAYDKVKKESQLEKITNEQIQDAHSQMLEGDEYQTGLYMRLKGKEYGATTGRPRRCGWLDGLMLKHCVKVNGPNIIITKLDILSDIPELKICTSYEYVGDPINYQGELLTPGSILKEFPLSDRILANCKPFSYETIEGFSGDISSAKNMQELPLSAQKYLQAIEKISGAKICVVSVGPERSQTINLQASIINNNFLATESESLHKM